MINKGEIPAFSLSGKNSDNVMKFLLVQFSRSVSDSLRRHESQHGRPPCPSPTPGVHSNSRPLSQWCHPAISSSVVPFSSCPQSLPASVFSNESTLLIRWPKYWSFSFSISPSKEIPGLIFFIVVHKKIFIVVHKKKKNNKVVDWKWAEMGTSLTEEVITE